MCSHHQFLTERGDFSNMGLGQNTTLLLECRILCEEDAHRITHANDWIPDPKLASLADRLYLLVLLFNSERIKPILWDSNLTALWESCTWLFPNFIICTGSLYTFCSVSLCYDKLRLCWILWVLLVNFQHVLRNCLHETGMWACLSGIFLLMIDVGGPRRLGVMPSLGMYKKTSLARHGEQANSSILPWSLLQFLPPDSCLEFQVLAITNNTAMNIGQILDKCFCNSQF